MSNNSDPALRGNRRDTYKVMPDDATHASARATPGATETRQVSRLRAGQSLTWGGNFQIMGS